MGAFVSVALAFDEGTALWSLRGDFARSASGLFKSFI
jgi:hypothetical protein